MNDSRGRLRRGGGSGEWEMAWLAEAFVQVFLQLNEHFLILYDCNNYLYVLCISIKLELHSNELQQIFECN